MSFFAKGAPPPWTPLIHCTACSRNFGIARKGLILAKNAQKGSKCWEKPEKARKVRKSPKSLKKLEKLEKAQNGSKARKGSKS